MIVISGAAGKTGLAVIAALSRKGEAVRALVKGEGQAARAANVRAAKVRAVGATQVTAGDMREPAVWREALRGARAVYHIGPNMHVDEAAMGRVAVEEARRARVARFVYHSVLHPQTEAMPHHWHKLRVEEMILASGLPFTILQPAAYMQNILGGWEAIVNEGVMRVPYPIDTRLSLVHLADVAEIATRALCEPGHANATYELAGTEPLAQIEVAALLGEALGREVRAKEVALAQWQREAEAAGIGPYARQTLLMMFRYYAAYGLAGNSRVLTWLLGRAPRTVGDLVDEVEG